MQDIFETLKECILQLRSTLSGLKFRRLEFLNFGKTVFLHKNILWYMTHMLMKKNCGKGHSKP